MARSRTTKIATNQTRQTAQTGRASWHSNYMTAWNNLQTAIGYAPLTAAQRTDILTPLAKAAGNAVAQIAQYECASAGFTASTPTPRATQQRRASRRGRQADTAAQTQVNTSGLSEFQQKLVGALTGSGGMTPAQLAQKVGSKPMTIGRALGPIVKKRAGLVYKKDGLFALRGAEVHALRTGTGG